MGIAQLHNQPSPPPTTFLFVCFLKANTCKVNSGKVDTRGFLNSQASHSRQIAEAPDHQ